MRKAAVVLLCLVGCGEPRYVAKPLPELIANPKRTPLAVQALLMPDGERLRWEVHHKGFTIGRAELVVEGSRISSRFKTSQLASMFAKASHELVTSIGRTWSSPEYASEQAEVNGVKEAYETSFDGSVYMIAGKGRRIPNGVAHTLHTALGVLRAWASPTARPGYLNVLHAGELVHFDVDTPTVEDWRGTRTLKIEGRIIAVEQQPILVTLWLTDNQRRIPIRIAISADGKQLDAETIEE